MIKRQKILLELKSLLENIKISNGYITDFPEVKIWSTQIEPKSDQVYCVIKDTGNEFTDEKPLTEILHIEIAVGCVKASNNYYFLTYMIDDVYKCIFENQLELQTTFGGLIINPLGDEIDIQQFEYQVAEAIIKFDFVHNQNARWLYDYRNY